MSMKMQNTDTEYLTAEIIMDLSWDVDIGQTMTDFFHRLKDEKCLYGSRCGSCDRVYLPPRPICGDCWVEMDEFVPLGLQGTIIGKTICYYKILDSLTGKPRKTPFVLGLIQLDGADTTLNHFVDVDDPAKVAIGDRVETIFREPLQGNVGDIIHFKWLPPSEEKGTEDVS